MVLAMFILGVGPVEFPDYESAFHALYTSRGINPQDDRAIVDFLKRETGFTHTSGTGLREERLALELGYLADLAENTLPTKPQLSEYEMKLLR